MSMDSKSSGPPPFDDPEQWWQPDAQDDPNWSPGNPFAELGAIFSDFGVALVNGLIQPLTQIFNPPPGVRGLFMTDEEVLNRLAEQMKAMEPVLEVTQGHWTVCKHRPRCKKPPAHVVFNRPKSESKRAGHKWPIVIRG